MTLVNQPIQSGKLCHPVRVYQLVESRSTSGAVIKTPTLLGSRRANIRPIAGGETIRGEQVQADLTHEVQMRWWSAVLPTMHLEYDYGSGGPNRKLEIVRIINVGERGVEMILLCRELV